MNYNRINVAFGALRKTTAPAINYQYDVTQVLVIRGLNLPEYYVVDFCNEGDATVIPITGTSDGVEIPDSLLQTGKTIKAYLVVASGEGDVQTRYEIKIPVNTRPQRSDIEPTDPQQQQIDALVATMNDAVTRSEAGATAAEESAEQSSASADASGNSATLSKSWAVGGTGARTGEDTNNSKYFAQRSEAAAQRAESAEDNALGYTRRAETAAENAAQSAETATAKASDASASASHASSSATSASTSAGTAIAKASEAESSAITASSKASEAASSASASERSATAAQTAQSKAEDAQAAAEATLEELTTPTASATTLAYGNNATATYANGHFTFGIPQGKSPDATFSGTTLVIN